MVWGRCDEGAREQCGSADSGKHQFPPIEHRQLRAEHPTDPMDRVIASSPPCSPSIV